MRGIILRGDRIALVHSLEYDYYKFPGGGIEPGEDHRETLIREVAEESGLVVRPDTIRPYGMVRRIEHGDPEDIFLQENFYYFCETEDRPGAQRLTPSEQRARFALEYVRPAEAVAANRSDGHAADPQAHRRKYRNMLEREARVLELLIAEGHCR